MLIYLAFDKNMNIAKKSQMLLVHQVQLHPTLPLLWFSSKICPLMLMGSKWQSWAINISLLAVPISIQYIFRHQLIIIMKQIMKLSLSWTTNFSHFCSSHSLPHVLGDGGGWGCERVAGEHSVAGHNIEQRNMCPHTKHFTRVREEDKAFCKLFVCLE